MEINYDNTDKGTERCIIRLENGDVFKGYKLGNQFQFNGRNKQQGICSLKKEQIETIFEKANTLANFGGRHIDFLNSINPAKKQNKNHQTVTSNDGLYKFRYYSKQDKGGIIIAAVYEGKERKIRPILSFEEEEKAHSIIVEIKKEYDTTGRFKSERNISRGTPFPHEYFDESKEENLNFDNPYYESILAYILNGFEDNGNSLIIPGETLHLYCVDGFEISLEDTDSLRVNKNEDILIIHTCNAPDNELLIPVDKISRVLLSRE